MLRIILVIVAGMVFFSACQKSLDLGDRSFMGAIRIGDGLQIDINKDKIKLQLDGKMRDSLSGTLLPIPEHENAVFRLKEKPDLQIILSPDDLVIFGTKGSYAKFGVGLNSHRKSYEIGDINGKYNFIVQYFPENHNKFRFGTFEIGVDHSWRAWIFGDGIVHKHEPGFSGHWVDSGRGEIQAFLENKKLFATLVLSEKGGDLLVINLLAKNGLALGMKRTFIEPGSFNGEYSVLSSNGKGIKKADVRDAFAFTGTKELELIYNDPWDGFFRDNKGELLGIFSPKICFGLNIGAVSGSQYIFAAVKRH